MDERRVSFGNRLRRYRAAAGMTQGELAARAGLSANTVGQIERGERRRPYPRTVAASAKALGLSPAEEADLAAAGRLRNGEDGLAAAPGAWSRAATATPLIGREAEVAAVAEMVAGARLVTLTGPGGVGKTRLALAVAATVTEPAATGAIVVPLASLADPALVLPTIAEAVGLGEASLGSLTSALAGRLLVLDNLEHLPGAVSALAALLGACPSLRILATSRAPLRLRGEREYPVAPLAPPALRRRPTAAEVAASPAARLFVARCCEASPAFALTDDNAPAVAVICQRLDGLPLAIELAAARIERLPPVRMLGRLDRALPLLVGRARDLPDRQRTMRQAIAWSYDLLDPGEQRLFRWLAVFAGGFSLFAVESVAGNDQGATPLVLLSSLLEKSLLRRLPDGQVGAGTAAEEPRFGMLETVREFGLERLAASGEEAAARRAHAAFVLALLREFERSWYEPAATGRRGGWGRERDNVRATLAWLERTGTAEEALELAVAAGVFWYCHGVGDGRRWLGRLLRRGDRAPSATRAMALMWASNLAAKQGDGESALALASESVAVARASGDHASLSEALCALGGALRDRGRAAESGPLFAEAWEIFRARGMAAHGAHALLNLGLLAEEEGDPARAAALCAEALALRRQLGQPVGVAIIRHALADLERRRGHRAEAAALYRENLATSRDLDQPDGIADALTGLAMTAAANEERAVGWAGAAAALRDDAGAAIHGGLRDGYGDFLRRYRAALGDAAFAAAWEGGRARPVGEVVAEALAAGAAVVPPAASLPVGRPRAGVSDRRRRARRRGEIDIADGGDDAWPEAPGDARSGQGG